MISKDTIEQIIYYARIDEVVGDFVPLKKRGSNMWGCCPFHNEKTPSFSVSPSKGIYKCFGCGKAGNSINFVMEVDKKTYPEALRYLAKKYNIHIEEKEVTPEELAAQGEKESLRIINTFANKYFQNNLWETDEGKSIGLSYFRERGFRDDIIRKFELGFSFEDRKALTKAAIEAGYNPTYLVKTGLSILPERHANETNITEAHIFDRFAGRVMFPIRGVSGDVVGFGGRILGNNKETAKYLNSPQSEIYDKSKILYGLYESKKSIQQEEFCFMVEGYTDVIALHQAGIENVVASSGTSLTVDQIKLVQRFTNNITILYDGDSAGQKAADRGVGLVLEEGMNVRVLLFPDNDDPDSYAKKVSADELKSFIKNNSHDFITYSASRISEEEKKDPIKKTGFIRHVIEIISLIPDSISRSVYIKECSRIVDVDEQILTLEVNKIRFDKETRKQKDKNRQQNSGQKPNQNSGQSSNQNPNQNPAYYAPHPDEPFPDEALFAPESLEAIETEQRQMRLDVYDVIEKNICRLLLKFGHYLLDVEIYNQEGELMTMQISVAEFILVELFHDELTFVSPVNQLLLDEYVHELREDRIPQENYFIMHPNPAISQMAVQLAEDAYQLSENWLNKYGVHIETEIHNVKKTVEHALYVYKDKRLMDMIQELKETLKDPENDDEMFMTLSEIRKYESFKARVNKLLGRTIVK
ncbi:MAG: primase [Bacteroidetes bacterium]|nr:primase [Bacteroidota bacterium]